MDWTGTPEDAFALSRRAEKIGLEFDRGESGLLEIDVLPDSRGAQPVGQGNHDRGPQISRSSDDGLRHLEMTGHFIGATGQDLDADHAWMFARRETVEIRDSIFGAFFFHGPYYTRCNRR